MKFTTIDNPNGAGGTFANRINDAGTVVGYYIDADGNTHGFTDTGGVFATVDDPNGVQGTGIFGVNDAGTVVGLYQVGTDNIQGFTEAGGTFTAIDDPNGPTSTYGHGINDTGTVVGTYIDATGEHGFTKTDGTYTTLNDPNAATGTGGLGINVTVGTNAVGINDAGTVVGDYINSNNMTHGFTEIRRLLHPNRRSQCDERHLRIRDQQCRYDRRNLLRQYRRTWFRGIRRRLHDDRRSKRNQDGADRHQ